jgi:hypothetical protein
MTQSKTMTRSFILAAFAVCATSPALAQKQPDVRPLGAIEATSTETFGPMVTVRHTSGGVLVNDARNRRVLLLDSALQVAKVVADSTPATATAYSGRMGGLIAYTGDSSLFVDPQSMSMLLIDPDGKVARVMSVPRSQDAMMLGSPIAGTPGFDASGGLVYRGSPQFQMRRPARAAGSGGGNAFQPPEFPDSTPVVRVDLASRQVDTLGYVRIPRLKLEMTTNENGRVTMSSVMNPLPVIDDWAVLSDGSVALLRGQDYSIDWIRPDGSRESTGKIPFDWRRLSDEDKVAFMDSVKAQRTRLDSAQIARDSAEERQRPAREQAARRAALGGGAGGGGGGGGGGMGGARVMIQGGDGGGTNMTVIGPGGRGQMSFVPPEELPDYQPVFFANSVRADADGNLWVRTIPTRSRDGGAVYDVINGKGELVDRVQVPVNRTIVGFGQAGIVYLAVTQGTGVILERARSR